MLNVKELSLDLGKRTSNQHVIIAQGDTRGTSIVATIYDHGTKLADTDLTAYFVMLLPDGEHYVRDAAEYDTGVITYTVNESYAAAVTGYTPVAYFELHDGRDTLVATTERFSVTIEQCAYDGLEPAESWDSEIAQLVIDGCNAVNAVEDALETLVDQEQSMLTGATATVDSTTGTPSVTVTMGEPQEGGRSANFAFTGIKGEDGERGQQGADGYSPTVNISSTTDEHIVTITDAQGAHTYTVDTYADEEQARATAETARSNAELARASEWATIKTEAETATSDANVAASDATAAAAEARAASAATWLSGNVLFGELEEAAVLTADDVYTAPPKGVEVYGVSTQASYTGKNLFDQSQITSSTSASILTVQLAAGTTYTASSTKLSGSGGFDIQADGTSLSVNTAVYSGHPVTFTTDANGTGAIKIRYYNGSSVPLSTYNFQIEVGSTATAYEKYVGGKPAPNPDYPQEIKSVDDLTLHVCGKNLLPKSAEATRTYRGITFSTSGNGEVVISGTYTSGSNDVNAPCGANGFGINSNYFTYVEIQEDYAIYLPAGTYTFSADITNRAGSGQAVIVIGNIGQTVMTGASYKGIISGREPQTFTTTGGFAMLVVGTVGNVATVDATISNIQLELGTTATTYAPYVGQSVEIPLGNNKGRSLPDGTRDTLTLSYIGPSETEGWGVYRMSLNQVAYEVDLGDLTWVRSTAYGYFGSSNLTPATASYGSQYIVPNARCTAYIVRASAYVTNLPPIGIDGSITTANGNEIRVRDERFTDAVSFKAGVSGVKLVYPLATPITTDLGTVELPILPNPLTAWADGGSAQPTMQLEYERDVNIALVIERDKAMAEIAPLESSPTKANHSVGTYLMYGGTLYKVTRAIASGEQITPGTNVTATTVAAELLALA